MNFRNISHRTNDNTDELDLHPLEVVVNNGNFEDASRRFKTLVQAEGIINAYRQRQAYEKPSERKRRKQREAAERKFLQETREAQMLSGEWDKRQKRKEQKRQEKAELRRKTTNQAE